MPVGLRLRKDAKIKPRTAAKGRKPSKISFKYVERKDFVKKAEAKKQSRGKFGAERKDFVKKEEAKKQSRGKFGDERKDFVRKDEFKTRNRRKFEVDDIVSDHKLYDRESGKKRKRDDDKKGLSQSKPPKWKSGRGERTEFSEDDSNEETMRSKAWRREKIDSKGKKGVDEVKISDKEGKSEEQADETAKKKQVRFQTRVLDKTGKKVRGHKKALDDESEAAEAPPKSRKRIIKLDPYDISNKRLDDGIPSSEKNVETEVELSKNAQFRSIRPSPSVLSFVEDNFLGRRRMIELQNAGYNVKLSAPLDNVPFSNSAERGRIEENVFRNKLEFFAAAKISSSFPPSIVPEIAFAGRSNVGKSSLLNALTRQWGVVRTSDKPGYTQTINFFRLASKLCLVDLPGYGFAYAKEEVKDTWEQLVKEYVSTRVGLKRVCLLVDTKWGLRPRDHELIDLMERSQTPYQIVLTKTDAVFPIDVARRAMQVQENLKANNSIVNPVMMVSSKTGAGIRSLRTVLAKIARFAIP